MCSLQVKRNMHKQTSPQFGQDREFKGDHGQGEERQYTGGYIQASIADHASV
jgi:hypothetical protein